MTEENSGKLEKTQEMADENSKTSKMTQDWGK